MQIAALCLSAALLLALGGEKAAAAPAPSGRTIRVGLHYGTGAVEGLNLANETGAGFRFGYYDGENRFVELGGTPQTAISVVETMNVYYGAYDGYTSYHSAPISSVAVGEYHLELPGAYGTFAEAQMAASAYDGGFPAYIGGMFYARIGNYTTRDGAVAAQGALSAQGVYTELRGTSEFGVSVVVTGTSTILFQYDDLGNGTGLGVEPAPSGPEKCITWSKSNKYYGGFRFERIKGAALTVVNILDMEDYVKGVVPTEMSDSWPLEALKAQAVAARSYAIALGVQHGSHHFDICDDVDCQAYTGQTRAGANSNAAVDQTAGQVVLYNGQVASTFYYSSNGGASESISVAWESSQTLYPYLVGVVDPYEPTLNLNNSWTRTVSSAELTSKVLKEYRVNGAITSASISAYTPTGNPKTVTFTDSAGERYTVSTYKVVRRLGLRSYRYGFAGGTPAQPAPEPAQPSSSSVSINGGVTGNGLAGLYAIDGSGNLAPVGGEVYVVTDSGTSLLGQGGGQTAPPPVEWGGSATAVNGSITFAGRGWGHNIGMSQFGAKAMAEQGYPYDQILQFYYTGVTVGYV